MNECIRLDCRQGAVYQYTAHLALTYIMYLKCDGGQVLGLVLAYVLKPHGHTPSSYMQVVLCF